MTLERVNGELCMICAHCGEAFADQWEWHDVKLHFDMSWTNHTVNLCEKCLDELTDFCKLRSMKYVRPDID